jgi:hypothetical protein
MTVNDIQRLVSKLVTCQKQLEAHANRSGAHPATMSAFNVSAAYVGDVLQDALELLGRMRRECRHQLLSETKESREFDKAFDEAFDGIFD